jgi:hypothetical protein
MTHWKVSEFQLYCLVIKAQCLTRSINVNISNERWMEEKKTIDVGCDGATHTPVLL